MSTQQYEMQPTDPFMVPADPTKVPLGPRAKMAFDMRVAGAPYDVIAENLGYSSGETARSAIMSRIQSHYKASRESIAEVVEMELRRLDELQLICWRRAKDGDLPAIDRILRIMERRAKLLDLDHEATQQAGTINNNTAIVIAGNEESYKQALQQARELASKGESSEQS